MKHITFLFLVLVSSICVTAQPSQEQRIQDTVLGWWSKQKFNEIPKPYTSRSRTFTTKQQQHMMNVIEWMKKSYTPVAGLGWFKRVLTVNDDLNFPHSYGVDFRVWNVSFEKEYLDKEEHFTPVPEEYQPFGVTANSLIGSHPINYINTPSLYLFALEPDGYKNYIIPKMLKADPKIHPHVYKYITRITDGTMTVYLAPGNKLPIIPVSKGEFLTLAYEAMDRLPERNRQYITDLNKGDQKKIDDAMNRLHAEIASYKNNINRLREKYKNKLNEQAIINQMQPNERNFYGNDDPFTISTQERNTNNLYEVYKIETSVLNKCKTDQPQWLAIWFPFETKEDGNQLYELCRALQEHFNYDYAYNYFFNPEKIKGIAYKPINGELLQATLDKYRKKEYWTNTTANTPLPVTVHFMDDFSTNAVDNKPAGWFFNTYGKHCLVKTVNGQPGKWVQLGYNNELMPISLKKPLPLNCTLEYEMVTDDFTTRSGGAAFLYVSTWASDASGKENKSGNGASIKIEVIPGNEEDYKNNNYRGLIKIELNKQPEVNQENFSGGASFIYECREFTNKKNKVHVAVKINNGEIKLFINNKQVVVSNDLKLVYGGTCKDCTIKPGLQFNTIYWKNTTNDADKTSVYISNIKITKN